MISLIAALSSNLVIGDDHGMPWHLPADLKRFRRLTLGKPIIMGRTTFAHIGKPLDQRTNIVLTRKPNVTFAGVLVAHSLPEALALAGAVPEVMIVGGGEVYQSAIAVAERLYLTLVEGEFTGTAYFPAAFPTPIGFAWQEVQREHYPADAKNPHAHTFIVFDRVPHPEQQEATLFELLPHLGVPVS